MSKIADKIRKLLELARRGGTEQEAHVAAAQAARLMAKHSLSESDVEDQIDGNVIDAESSTTVFQIDRTSSAPIWMQSFAADLARMCGCFMWRRSRTREYVKFEAVGRPRDLATYSVLLPAMIHTLKKLINKRTREARDPYKVRIHFSPSDYARGLAYAIANRMMEAQNEVLDEVRRSSRTALEHVGPDVWAKRAKEAVEKIRDIAKARTSPDIGDPRSTRRGMVDARRIKLPGEHEAITGLLSIGDGKEIQ